MRKKAKAERSRSMKKQKVETEREKKPIEIIDLEADELPLISFSQNGKTKETAIPIDQYTEDRDLQLALLASLGKPTPTITILQIIDLDDYDDQNNDLHVLNFEPEKTCLARRRKPLSRSPVTEAGESSNSGNEDPSKPSFVCEICFEPKAANESFSIKGCSHAYCNDCMVKYVASKLQENITSIACPIAGCRGLLEPGYCRNLLPQDVFDRWGNALCEAMFLGVQKLYCPYKDCSGLLIDDGGEIVTVSECPYCKRLFCAQCKVPWHEGIECTEFRRLSKDERDGEDIMLMQLAHNNQWKRCPNCKFYVEKKSGCNYMKCRCGSAFCYNCCAQSDQNSHICPNCGH